MKYMVISFICLLLLMGCITPNLCRWYNANIEANGAIGRKNKVVFYNIRIGTKEFPYDGKQTFAIRLPSGVVLSSDDFSESKIHPIALAMSTTGNSIIKHDQASGKSEYFLEGVTFTYEQKQLTAIYISWVKLPGKLHIPEIAKTVNDTFLPLPVPESHLIEIFGLPDKKNESFVW